MKPIFQINFYIFQFCNKILEILKLEKGIIF